MVTESQFPDVTASATVAPTATLDELVDRSGDLKGELVEFAQGPRFATQLRSRLRKAADSHGDADEATMVTALDHFALQHRLRDGRTVAEVFVACRKPPLSDDERAMVLGWRDVVEGVFEVRGFDGSGVVLHNLVDDLAYRVRSNLGREVFAGLPEGGFALCRIVPVHPASGEWLVSGHIMAYPESGRHELAQSALQTLTSRPELLARNADLVRRAWEMQAEDRAAFIELCGADLVVLPPEEAQRTLREHYRRRIETATANAAEHASSAGPSPAELGALPEQLLSAESVGLVYDEVDGLNYYRNFGRLDALFSDPALSRDWTYLALLREYLADESVSPLAIRRLVQRHPEGADPVFRALLRKPGFCWQRDGEALLRDRKKEFVESEPAPSFSCVGERLRELLGIDSAR